MLKYAYKYKKQIYVKYLFTCFTVVVYVNTKCMHLIRR